MYEATAESLPKSSTQQRDAEFKFLSQQLIDCYTEPPEPGQADSVCPCGELFEKKFAEQLRCPRCRSSQLTAENRLSAEDKKEIALFNQFRDQWENHANDWQLHDPDHPDRLIWASDLAKRYRLQTTPRPVRNGMTKWY